MRGGLVALLILAWVPFILFKPHIGVLVWNWVSHMAPQFYTYNFARTFPFLVLIFGITMLGMIVSKEKNKLPGHPVVAAMFLYWLWIVLTTLLAYEPAHSQEKFVHLTKVMVFAFIAMAVMQSPNRLKAFVWIMVISLGFIAVKGGLFTLATGGVARVQGAGGMMQDNNQLSMAMAMLVPFGVYMVQHPPHPKLKLPMIGAALTVPLASLGTQSRGGFVAVSAVLMMLILKTKHRFKLLLLMVILGGAGWQFAPDSYKNRIASTENAATEDLSFRGRVSMWKFSVNLADEHPVEGGGFDIFYVREAAERFMPPGFKARAPHSIYFEVLAEHGYFGLTLFLTMIFTGWYAGATCRKDFQRYQETVWLADLATACQLALIGYSVGGLTVNIATFDVFYHVLAIIVMVHVVGRQLLAGELTEVGTGNKIDARAAKNKWTPSGAAAPQHTR